MHQHASDDGKSPRRVRAQALADWSVGLASGHTFADSVALWVPPSHRMLLEAGERAKALGNALEVCAWLEESASSMRAAVYAALLGPFAVVAMVLAVYIYFGLEVFPQLEFIVPQSEWPGVASLMPGIMDFILTGPLVLCFLGFIVFGIVMVWIVLPRWTSRWRTYFEWWLPFRLYRMFVSSFLLIGLTGLLRANVLIDDAIVLLQHGQPPWVRSRLHMIKNELLRGRSPGDAFWYADRHFPSIEINRELRIVFSFAKYDDVIYNLARRWVTETVERIRGLAGLLRFMAQAVNGMMMVMLVFSLMQISSAVNN